MITELNLPNNIFNDSKLTDIKQKNFIFGRNGTGKSSITKAIVDQYGAEYDIRVFQGFQRIVENNGELNAIALGSENAEIQPKIDSILEQISDLNTDIIEPANDVKNTFSLKVEMNKQYDEQARKVEKFYIHAASDIKDKHTDWTGHTYNKNHLKKDIDLAKKLSDDSIKRHIKILKQSSIDFVEQPNFEIPSLKKFLDQVNELITTDITKNVLLKFDSDDKMNWAKHGLMLHKKGDSCAFCGGKLTDKRLNELNNSFNTEVIQLGQDINLLINELKIEILKIDKLPLINREYYYLPFREDISKLNEEITQEKSKITDFIENLIYILEQRNKSIFVSLEKININLPESIPDIDKKAKEIYKSNLEYHGNLNDEKNRSKNELKLNEVAEKIINFNYFKELAILNEYKNLKENADKEYSAQVQKLKNADNKLKELQSMTIDESIAADKINKLLTILGNQSFSLKNTNDEFQKGQYKIIGYDGNERNIYTLSTGEKNIVAFLWFILDLDNIRTSSEKEMIVIFDDPMNSNDDSVQYMIISEIQHLLKNSENKQIFILTHNMHFYLNTRYRWWDNKKSLKKTYHLIKSSKKSSVKLIEKENDITTSYKSLWAEVGWLYNQHKPEFMLNPLRRILETYRNFNGIENEEMFEQDAEAQKLFNVNSHGLEDLIVNLNGKDEAAIINKVKKIFENINGLDHFNYYWNNASDSYNN